MKNNIQKTQANKTVPFGANYFVKPNVDKPGPVWRWNWIPEKVIMLTKDDASSWPGTTGTGPKAKEDERYQENQ
ncbi:hypothetical protein HQ531_06020 [bacterium]|nr:hypothetical protein [bacterium]